MKGKLLILALCIAALAGGQAQASVFSGSGGSALQSVFNSLGYGHIDVANYQTDLNFQLQGMMEFELLSRSRGYGDLRFGLLEQRQNRWGALYRHHEVFGSQAREGSSRLLNFYPSSSTYGFYIEQRDPFYWWKTTRSYSYSAFNKFGAVQALFYEDPLESGSYLIAWQKRWSGYSHYDRSYDDLVVKMSGVHPAPEPATWLLLTSGLVGAGAFLRARKTRHETKT